MNREQMTAPFAEEELRQFEGRGGKTMTYIEDETVMDRLDAGYGFGNWQIQCDVISENVVKVRLGVREHVDWVWYEDFGYPNSQAGETLKEAVSDGIRRCGRFVGIARDLYRKSTYEPGGQLAGRDQKRAAPAAVDALHDPETGGLMGKAEARGNDDFELRPEKTRGHVLPFRLTEGRDSVKVAAFGHIAEAIARVKPDILGQRITVWGSFVPKSFDKTVDGKKKTINYQVFELTKLQSPDWIIPTDEPVDELPPDDLDLTGVDDAMVAAGR